MKLLVIIASIMTWALQASTSFGRESETQVNIIKNSKIFETINSLNNLNTWTMSDVVKLLGPANELQLTNQNGSISFYKMKSPGPIWQEIDLRLPESNNTSTKGFLVLTAVSGIKITKAELTEAFANPVSAQPYIIMDAPPTGQIILRLRLVKSKVSFIVDKNDELKTLILEPLQGLLSKEQALKIARDRALADVHGMFRNPYTESVDQQVGTGHWVIKILSEKPTASKLGEMYMHLVIDKTNGAILSIDTGGGS